MLSQELEEGPARAHVVAAAAAALPPERAAAAEGLARLALGMVKGATGEGPQDTVADVAVALAGSSPKEAADTARSIPEADARNMALARVAERVAVGDLKAGLDLLATVDDPLASEPVVSKLAVRLARTDPERALTLARTLLNRRLRVECILGIAGALGASPAKP